MDLTGDTPYVAALLVMCAILVIAGIAVVVYISRQTKARHKRLIAEGKMKPLPTRKERRELRKARRAAREAAADAREDA